MIQRFFSNVCALRFRNFVYLYAVIFACFPCSEFMIRPGVSSKCARFDLTGKYIHIRVASAHTRNWNSWFVFIYFFNFHIRLFVPAGLFSPKTCLWSVIVLCAGCWGRSEGVASTYRSHMRMHDLMTHVCFAWHTQNAQRESEREAGRSEPHSSQTDGWRHKYRVRHLIQGQLSFGISAIASITRDGAALSSIRTLAHFNPQFNPRLILTVPLHEGARNRNRCSKSIAGVLQLCPVEQLCCAAQRRLASADRNDRTQCQLHHCPPGVK